MTKTNPMAPKQRLTSPPHPSLTCGRQDCSPSGETGAARTDQAAGKWRMVKSRATPTWKRAMDVIGSIGALFLLSPLLVLVAILIKITSRGPVIFRQKRIGLGGEPFTILKFRTMNLGADAQVHRQYVTELLERGATLRKLELNADLIPLGGGLRKLSLDELPQLINVLAGSMSLVGPRPDVIPKPEYPTWQQKRFDVKPGITGLWQVSGKNSKTHTEMVQLDIEYASRMSVSLDLWILLKTLPVVAMQVTDKKPC